jgi:hypothetical protein
MADSTNYINTIIFCVICNFVFVMLIVLLFVGALDPAKYVLITVELCLMAIILNAILSIYFYERNKQQAARMASQRPLPIETCPEYFVRRVGADNNIQCNNRYITPNTGEALTILGAKNALSVNIDLTNQVMSKTGEYVCQEYRSKWQATVPWTDMQAQCETM